MNIGNLFYRKQEIQGELELQSKDIVALLTKFLNNEKTEDDVLRFKALTDERESLLMELGDIASAYLLRLQPQPLCA